MATVNSSSPSSCPKPVRYCLCAPTTHPGSFRCRLHRPRAAAKAPTRPSGSDQPAANEAAAAAEKKEEEEAAAAAATARALLARVARTSMQNVGRAKGFEPAPSRLRIMDG